MRRKYTILIIPLIFAIPPLVIADPAGSNGMEAFLTVEALDTIRAQSLRRDLGEEAVSSWRIHLNLDALTAIEAPDGSRIATARGAALAGQHLDLPIPGREAPMRLNLETVYEGYAGVITYAGTIDGDDGSLVAISIDGDEILGKIHHSEGFTYLIESAMDGPEYTLSVIDQTLMPQPPDLDDHQESADEYDSARPGSTESRPSKDVQPMSWGGEVRLLVLYTPAVAAQTNITLLANNVVSTFNQSLGLSGVSGSNFVTLADLRNIGNNLATVGRRCRKQIIDNMGNRVHEFSLLDNWMEVAWADIGLTIMTTEPGYSDCGSVGRIGGIGTFPGSEYPGHSKPFANTSHTFALGDLTAIHEVGHVLNGHHETPSHCAGAIPSYACGYAPAHCNWQAMMGGYVQCGYDFGKPPNQQSNVRIARWSNPNVSYNGEATGTSARNMAAALNINMPYAAGWKGAQAPPPSAPNPISVSPQYCWGLNLVAWTAQSGTVEYRLFQSDSPSFTFPYLVYSGPGTATFINVSGTAYLRARACNSGGCSAYSTQVTATYYPGCA